MILYIAEKPSLAKALAAALPQSFTRTKTHFQASNGDVVSWCVGHLLEQAEPDAYNPEFKQWRLEHLPIIPDQWQLKPKANTRAQLTAVKALINKASQLVHVGDPDREGQLLVDEVISFCKASQSKIQSTQRCLISDLNPAAIKKALAALQPNQAFVPLSVSALARSRADWLYGINMTRLCTLKGQQSGYQGVLSVGRVQTPILGLVVQRDLDIEHFVSKPFYELQVSLIPKEDKTKAFNAKWKPSEACQPYMDEENRVLSKSLVENVAKRVINQQGEVTQYKQSLKKQAPPLPYSLSALQVDAARQLNLSASDTLDICQRLYEQHQLITYPRSDCRYLPEGHFSEADAVLAAVQQNDADFTAYMNIIDTTRRSKAWNDKKVTAHHAIIPTQKRMDILSLSNHEQKIYRLISRQYAQQFMADFQYSERFVQAKILTGLFEARSKQTVDLGWKASLGSKKEPEFNQNPLPEMAIGESVLCIETTVLERNTTPPRHFTDATLLTAMTGIARFVSDKSIKKVLRETDGLGTEATRASIIELLFKRDFLTRKGKEIHSTQTGRLLIEHLPTLATTPDMTAHWESQLESISQKKLSYPQFMDPLIGQLNQLTQQINTMTFSGLKGLGKPFKKKSKYKRKQKSAK